MYLYSIVLEVNWVPRENNKTADYFSKIIDLDDWEITEGFLNYLEGKWGPCFPAHPPFVSSLRIN